MALILGTPLLALFLVIVTGMALGRINLGGLSLGSSGVIFTALALGHLGYSIPGGVGGLGLVLFVYCVGITAGPRFFRAFVRQGERLALLGLALVVLGGGATYGFARLLAIPVDLALGVFAGAMTSTPALAAALEALPAGGKTAVGYGLAYPFGVVGVVLFVQLLPRLLHKTMKQLEEQAGPTEEDKGQVVHMLVEVTNPAVEGKTLDELDFLAQSNCLVSRELEGISLEPVASGLEVRLGQHLLLVGRETQLEAVIPLLGKRSARTDCVLETEQHRMRVVVTSPEVVGKTLAELSLRTLHGVTVARVYRHGVEFVPRPDTPIHYGNMLQVVGEPENLRAFAALAGHRARAYDETDLLSVGVGLVAGVLLGMVSFGLGGSQLSLGMAGGPLLVALVLGHFGRIGPVAGYLPRASRLLLQELGLVFFLADAGVKAGGQLVPVLSQYSASLLGAAAGIAFIPMVAGFVVARWALRMDLLQSLGAICGGMTSTPGLGVITSRTDHETPVISYATIYPVALILLTVCARLLALVL